MSTFVTPAICRGAAVVALVIVVAAAGHALAQKPPYDAEVEAVARGIFMELMSPY